MRLTGFSFFGEHMNERKPQGVSALRDEGIKYLREALANETVGRFKTYMSNKDDLCLNRVINCCKIV